MCLCECVKKNMFLCTCERVYEYVKVCLYICWVHPLLYMRKYVYICGYIYVRERERERGQSGTDTNI